MKLGSPWKTLVLGLGVFAVGVAGVFVGSVLRGSVGRTDAYVIPDPVATTVCCIVAQVFRFVGNAQRL